MYNPRTVAVLWETEYIQGVAKHYIPNTQNTQQTYIVHSQSLTEKTVLGYHSLP